MAPAAGGEPQEQAAGGEPQEQAAGGDDCPGGCSAIEKVLAEGLCRQEFLAFDGCYDAAVARGEDESACLHLFDSFRACIKQRATVDHVIKEAMGG